MSKAPRVLRSRVSQALTLTFAALGLSLSRKRERGHTPSCRAARSRMISSLPPPIALTRTSR